MKVVFSDLDGTLLHLQTYSSDAAQPALEALKRRGIPLVFTTSKTRAEVELWRERLDNRDPFIVENGGAIYIPKGYFGFRIPQSRARNGYETIECGRPYQELVQSLREASEESGCQVLGFHQMSVADISTRTLLSVQQAELAKRREYDEPFEILGSGTHRLLRAIEGRGMHWTRGDRFYHVTGNNDKSEAVRMLAAFFRKAHGEVLTIGIGDGHNDAAFLASVDVPIIVYSRFAAALKKAVPQSRVTQAPGPHGWNEAVLAMVAA
jgi:mannosyl-3-phosphoglycerate phosphatase